jgi:hypothetical protein
MVRLAGIFFACAIFMTSIVLSQRNDYEIGLEITAANGSNLGGTIGGSLKFAIVQDDALAFGPSIRYQYMWSNNTFTGLNQNASLYGGGGFLHYRLLEWFYVGTEIELLRNPFPVIDSEKEWSLTAFFGGGVHRDFDWVKLNLGLLYDAADAIRDPLTNNPSPLRNNYFLRRENPNPGSGPNSAYLPIIYRLTFFFPIG